MIYWKSDEDKFLDGELLFVPRALKEKIENENFRVEKRELIYLIWVALKSTPVERRSDWRRVHHGRFDYESSNSTNRTALLWLAKNGFIELDKDNSYWANPERGFPKKHRVIQKKQPVLIELENKSLVRGPKPYTQDEICCLYTREILDQLTVDREAVKDELRKTIFEYHQLGDLTRNRPFTEEKNRIKQEKERVNTEFVEGLYTFGLPLLHLVNRTGSIKRGKKGNRLFSPMTNVKKTFRQYFSLEGEPLVWLDMQAAHPTLLGNLSNDQYLINDCLSDEFYGRIMDELEVDRDTAKRRYMAWGDVRFVVKTLDGLACQNLSLQGSDFNDSLSFFIAWAMKKDSEVDYSVVGSWRCKAAIKCLRQSWPAIRRKPFSASSNA